MSYLTLLWGTLSNPNNYSLEFSVRDKKFLTLNFPWITLVLFTLKALEVLDMSWLTVFSPMVIILGLLVVSTYIKHKMLENPELYKCGFKIGKLVFTQKK